MKKRSIYIIGLVLVLAVSCSRSKDSIFSRNYHALTSKYNILYNGKLAYDKGIKQIEEEYTDNFWKRLPVEPMSVQGTIFNNEELNKELSKDKLTHFERAEEKAVKAIQRHGMNIRGYEKNSQIDDAYLLLGKSRYYTKRYIPAIEAFNYIMANYPGANLNYQTRVWRAKANTRLGNEDLAIETMNLLLEVRDVTETIPKPMVEEAYTAMAMAYSQTDTIQKFIHYLKKATETSYNKEQTARNLFILGQVYNELNQKDSAKLAFKRIAETRKFPRKYKLHATIELSKYTNSKEDAQKLIKRLKKATKNPQNNNFFDQLYFQLGNLYVNKNEEKAVEYYKKSLRTKKAGAYQKTYTYEKLGDLYFKNSDYLLAGAYYDSVQKVVPEEFKKERRIRQIKRQNKSLTSLRKYETILKKNDSILKLVAMPKSEQVAFFEKYIKKLKEEDEIRKQQLLNSQNFGGTSFKNKPSGKWYFYSPISKQSGEIEFKRIWGTIKLEDNWRWSDQHFSMDTNNEDKEQIHHKKYELQTYLKAIPKNRKKIQQLKEERNEALYQLGLIYKEKFKNNKLALERFERLKEIEQNKSLKLPLYYHLSELYSQEGNQEKANQTKDYIIKNYPKSEYANLLQNTGNKQKTETTSNEIEKKYEEIYHLYENGNYLEVVDQINAISTDVKESDLAPKFGLLKALAIGKQSSKDEFIKALDFVVVNYPNTTEGKKAKEYLTKLKK